LATIPIHHTLLRQIDHALLNFRFGNGWEIVEFLVDLFQERSLLRN
jgi:hypothetical protein